MKRCKLFTCWSFWPRGCMDSDAGLLWRLSGIEHFGLLYSDFYIDIYITWFWVTSMSELSRMELQVRKRTIHIRKHIARVHRVSETYDRTWSNVKNMHSIHSMWFQVIMCSGAPGREMKLDMNAGKLLLLNLKYWYQMLLSPKFSLCTSVENSQTYVWYS